MLEVGVQTSNQRAGSSQQMHELTSMLLRVQMTSIRATSVPLSIDAVHLCSTCEKLTAKAYAS
eukprot:6443762-Amphidinium_carterae.2